MAEAAHALGLAGEIEFRGKKYRLAPFNYEMAALFELWLEDRAWSSVSRCRSRATPEEYQERLKSVAKMIAAGELGFGTEAAAAAARTPAGLKYLLYLMLSANSQDVSEQIVEDMFEEQMELVLARMGEANRDPNSSAPAETRSA